MDAADKTILALCRRTSSGQWCALSLSWSVESLCSSTAISRMACSRHWFRAMRRSITSCIAVVCGAAGNRRESRVAFRLARNGFARGFEGCHRPSLGWSPTHHRPPTRQRNPGQPRSHRGRTRTWRFEVDDARPCPASAERARVALDASPVMSQGGCGDYLKGSWRRRAKQPPIRVHGRRRDQAPTAMIIARGRGAEMHRRAESGVARDR